MVAGGSRTPGVRASTLCYVVHSRDAVIVAFRGTRVFKPGAGPPTLDALRGVLADICTDGRLDLVDLGAEGAVHCGFYAAIEQVWAPMVLPRLDALRQESPGRTFWFTGHSLGAALATLAAARFPHVAGVYTFGSPLVGDGLFARTFPARAFRIVNNNDIVPQVPRFGPCATAPFLRGYEHVGELKYITHQGALQDQPSRSLRLADGIQGRFGQLRDVAEQLRSGRIAELPDDGFNDHAPLFYALRVWNAYAAGR
jgi:triacylglycerol lipase